MPSWNRSKKTASGTSINSEMDNAALQKVIVEQSVRITELEARLNVADVIDKNFDSLSNDELKKLCKELDNANKVLKKNLEQVTTEKDSAVHQLTNKMNQVIQEKDKQIKRQEALGAQGKEEDSKALGNAQGKGNVRMAISAETAKSIDPKKLPKVPKSKEDRQYIERALQSNPFFRQLKSDQINKIIDCMEKKKLKQNVEIIREGTDGTYLYLLEEGIIDIYNNKDGHIADLHDGKIFGELAIFYNCKRTASVRTKTDCTVYQLDRRYYKTIVQSTGAARDEARLGLLKLVPSLRDLGDAKLKKICDCLEDEGFNDGDCIIKQGTAGDTFYIIREGKVRCTKNQENGDEATVAELEKGAFFGELALLGGVFDFLLKIESSIEKSRLTNKKETSPLP